MPAQVDSGGLKVFRTSNPIMSFRKHVIQWIQQVFYLMSIPMLFCRTVVLNLGVVR